MERPFAAAHLARETARQTIVVIRSASVEDIGCLEAMLFEAFFWDPAVKRPAFLEFRQHPKFTKLPSGWGRHGDRGVMAEDNGVAIGAAWFRLWTRDVHSYGFLDASTPELAIAVSRQHRGNGIGRLLLHELIGTARRDRFPALSLSVSPFNPARMLYESEGFRKVGESGTSWTFRLPLD